MKTGVVKWFSKEKGYGFIIDDETKKDVFVHYSSIKMRGYRTLEPEVKVSYKLAQTDKGMQASEVEVL